MAEKKKKSALYRRISESMASGQAGLWIQSNSPSEVLLTLETMQTDYRDRMRITFWDALQGPYGYVERRADDDLQGGAPSAMAELQKLLATCELRSKHVHDNEPPEKYPDDQFTRVLVLRNGHQEISTRAMLAAMALLLNKGKAVRCHLIVLSFPGIELPIELREAFWVLTHELPGPGERKEIIQSIAEGYKLEIPSPEMTRLAKVSGGLTPGQVEDVCCLSILRHDAILEPDIWKAKAELLNKEGLLRMNNDRSRFTTFEDEDTGTVYPGLGGLEHLKSFGTKALLAGKPDHIRPRAFLLLGIPGTGKSAYAKALGNETGRPTLTMDIGTLMGGVVGKTEEQTRRALAIVDAMAPAILFIDELEKALGGGSGEHDGGVNSRLKGTLLTWLNDHTSDVLLIATANDVRILPPEFTRAERFDGVFFLDLPGREQKDAIWDIYLKYFGLDPKQRRPNDQKWTGAEIRACCRLAALFDQSLLDAAANVVPVIDTAPEQIRALRAWASKRCLDAEKPGVYIATSLEERTKEANAEPALAGRGMRRVRREG